MIDGLDRALDVALDDEPEFDQLGGFLQAFDRLPSDARLGVDSEGGLNLGLARFGDDARLCFSFAHTSKAAPASGTPGRPRHFTGVEGPADLTLTP